MSLSISTRAMRFVMALAITFTIATTISTLVPLPVNAAGVSSVNCGNNDIFGCGGIGTETGLYARDPKAIILAILKTAMGFLGLVAVVIILYGGFKWMTAAGNEEKVEEAKKLIGAGIIGLIIIITAYSIVTYVIQNLLRVTQQ